MDSGPANTLNYMIAGYTVIFGIIFLYIASLVVRTRNLNQEEEMLMNLEKE
jgi:CcmD family protein